MILLASKPATMKAKSLALAVAKTGLPFEMIEPRSLGKHFQSFKTDRGEDTLRRRTKPHVFDLVRSIAAEHPYLRQRMSESPNWAFLLEE